MNTITPFELAQLALLMKQQRGDTSDVETTDLDEAVVLVVKCSKAIADYRHAAK